MRGEGTHASCDVAGIRVPAWRSVCGGRGDAAVRVCVDRADGCRGDAADRSRGGSEARAGRGPGRAVRRCERTGQQHPRQARRWRHRRGAQLHRPGTRFPPVRDQGRRLPVGPGEPHRLVVPLALRTRRGGVPVHRRPGKDHVSRRPGPPTRFNDQCAHACRQPVAADHRLAGEGPRHAVPAPVVRVRRPISGSVPRVLPGRTYRSRGAGGKAQRRPRAAQAWCIGAHSRGHVETQPGGGLRAQRAGRPARRSRARRQRHLGPRPGGPEARPLAARAHHEKRVRQPAVEGRAHSSPPTEARAPVITSSTSAPATARRDRCGIGRSTAAVAWWTCCRTSRA